MKIESTRAQFECWCIVIYFVNGEFCLSRTCNYDNEFTFSSNSAMNNYKGNPRVPSKSEIVSYGIACLITISGIFGNSLVVVAVKKKRSLRSTTNYLLVNLAIADIFTLVFTHFGVLQPFMKIQTGFFADLLCKIFLSFNIPATAVASSIFTVTVVAVERYHAIVKPMRSGIRLRLDTVKYAIIGIWSVALLVTSPVYIKTYYDVPRLSCRLRMNEPEGLLYKSVAMITVVLIPLVTTVFCYLGIIRELYFNSSVTPQNIAATDDIQNKRKMIKVALYVTLSLLLCYSPALIVICVRASGYSSIRSDSLAMTLAWVLLYLEPVINPVIYAFQSTNFRDAFKEILRMRQAT